MNAYKIRNIRIYSITNNKQHAISNRFPAEQLQLGKSHRQAIRNKYGIIYVLTYLHTYLHTYLLTYLLYGKESFSRNYPFSVSQDIPQFYGTRNFITSFARAPHPFLTLSQINPVYGPSRKHSDYPT